MDDTLLDQLPTPANSETRLTRRRRIAAITLLVAGTLQLLLGIFLVAADAYGAYKNQLNYGRPGYGYSRLYYGRVPPPPPSDIELGYKTLVEMLYSDASGVGIGLVALAIVFMLISGGVRRGAYGSSCAALWSFSPIAVWLSLITAGCSWAALYLCFEERNLWPSCGYVGAAITGVLLCLIAWRMMRLLRCLARNPATQPNNRQFAARGLQLFGWLLVIFGSCLVISLGHGAGVNLDLLSRRYSDTRSNILELFNGAELYFALGCAGLGVAYLLLRRGVSRGDSAYTRPALWMVRALAGGMLLATPWCLWHGLTDFSYQWDFLSTHMMSAAMMGMVLVPAAWNVQAKLRWAMRNPIAGVPLPSPDANEPILKPGAESPPPQQMPRTFALSYFAGPTTAGQTPRIAAGVLLVLGWPLLLLGGLLLLDSIGMACDGAGWGWKTVSLGDVLAGIFADGQAYVGICILAAGALYVPCGLGILRRSYALTELAIWSFAPVVAVCCVLSALCLEEAISESFGLCVVRDITYVWFYLPGIFGILLTMLALDVLTILRWVARHHTGEMDRRMFLPSV